MPYANTVSKIILRKESGNMELYKESESISYQSSNGVNTIVASLWIPEGQPRGVIQICHGMCEHIGRYHWLAHQFNQHGFVVCGDDHLGHGRSATDEEVGYFGPKDGYIHLMEDEHLLRQEMQRRYPGLPYFLLGHSMGSFITRFYITRHAEGLNGYLCCGTSGNNPMAKLGILLANVTIALRGGRRTGNFLNKIAFQDYNSKFGEVVTGHEWLSRDGEAYKPFEQDKRCNFIFTNAGFRDMSRLLNCVSGRKWSEKVPKDLPVILLSGEMDPVGNYGKGVREVYGLLKAAGVRDLTMNLYPEARHELHNELNKDEVVADMVAWIEKHM